MKLRTMDSYVLCLFDQLLMLRMLTFQKVNAFQRNVKGPE